MRRTHALRVLSASLALAMLAIVAVSRYAAPAARAASGTPPTITATIPGAEGAPEQLTLVVTGERFTPGEQVRVVLCPPTLTGPGDPGPAVPAPCAPEVGTLLGEVTADSTGRFAFQTDIATGIARPGEDQRAIVEVLRAGETTPIASAVTPVYLPGSAPPSWGDNAGLIAAYFGLPLLIAALIVWGIIRGMRRPRLPGQAARGTGDAQPAG